MKYLKTFENYYRNTLRKYIENEDVETEDDILDEDEIEVNDVIKPEKKSFNDSINKLNNIE